MGQPLHVFQIIFLTNLFEKTKETKQAKCVSFFYAIIGFFYYMSKYFFYTTLYDFFLNSI